jgi:hypothetical protein
MEFLRSTAVHSCNRSVPTISANRLIPLHNQIVKTALGSPDYDSFSKENTMVEVTVAVINASTFIQNDQMKAAVNALQTQVHEDFAPVWGIDAKLTFLAAPGSGDKITDMLEAFRPLQGSWWLVILDNSDLAEPLGYYDLTHEGLPLEKVFAETDTRAGRIWTVSASSALLQMLADPAMTLTVFRQTSEVSGRLYAYDVCNPCKADKYEIDSIPVSNFVYPAWFEWFHKSGSGIRFDHMGRMQAPFELLPGGEIDVFDGNLGTGWRPLVSEGGLYEYRMRPRVGSRRERRRIPPTQLQASRLPGNPTTDAPPPGK